MGNYTAAELANNPMLSWQSMYEDNPYYKKVTQRAMTHEEATRAATTGVEPDIKSTTTYAETALDRIKGHYAGYAQDQAIPANTKLDLSTEEGRIKAMGMLSQQGGDSFNAEGGLERCGAASLLAGAMYGGTDGLTTLIDSLEAYKGKGKPGEGALPDEAMADLKEKILAGKEGLSLGDMHMMMDHMYKFFVGDVQDGKIGMGDQTMVNFLKNSPGMDKLFDEKDMQFDAFAGHMVLGIGRSEDRNGLPKGDPGARKMIYDPQGRVTKKLDANGVPVIDSTQRASQVVTDSTELLDYHTATSKTIDEYGAKSVDNRSTDWWKRTKDMYEGMYGGMY